MPRAPETPWNSPTIVPARPERLPEADRGLYCVCDYPCSEATCRRHLGGCAACEKHGQALYTRAEERYIENGGGLPKGTVEALIRNAGRHENHNSRLVRNGDPAYGAGVKPSESVAEAC